MATENIITVEHVSKRFRLKHSGTHTLKSTVLDFVSRRDTKSRDFWALRDVNFSVRRGETLGIIGANGAGKSTLLGLISRTSAPTEGTITANGSISSLLELGAGFHPDLTGRENVFLYGAIMGLSREQMRNRFDAIVEFAELGEWIEQPVKHYSSGMYVRLGFAVAVEVDPEILIVDEVLAVGDASFQRKCIQRIRDFKAKGKAMIVVSHDLDTIGSICERTLLLDKGCVLDIGDPQKVVTRYQTLALSSASSIEKREWGTREVTIAGVEFVGADGTPSTSFRWGEPLTARIAYEAPRRVENPVFGFAVAAPDGSLVCGDNTQLQGVQIASVEGKGTLAFTLEKLSMATGTYLFSFSVHSADHKTNYHRLDYGHSISVESPRNVEGCCYMPVSWKQGA